MTVLGWSFAAPALLWGLLALPVLWLILRAVPPAPTRRYFPAMILLLGLRDAQRSADRTPWWLLVLRALAVAAAIVGFAGPTRAPLTQMPSQDPLLIVMDGSWAQAQDWPALRAAALAALAEAGRQGRLAASIRLTDAPTAPQWQSADVLTASLAATIPAPRAPRDLGAFAQLLQGGRFETLWLSDGLDHAGRGALLAAVQSAGPVQVVLPARPAYGMAPASFDKGEIVASVRRVATPLPAEVTVLAIGTAPNGAQAELGRALARFDAGAAQASARFRLPPELRSRITRFDIEGQRSAGAVSLTDDTLKRRKVALIAPSVAAEGLQLLSPTHYLNVALAPSSDILRGSIDEVLAQGPDTIILADVAKIAAPEAEALTKWITQGGTLLRFAGPRLAAMAGEGAAQGRDELLPVRLRAGGRVTGGAMSWGEAKALAPFDAKSPFAGLSAPPDVTVSAQVLAQPDPDLAAATLATLADGTPLVTRRDLGAGQIVLFHITANAEWSTLPLSGLFVQMLERLSVASRTEAADQQEVAASLWQAQSLTDAFGAAQEGADRAGVDGPALWEALQQGPSAAVPAGLYAGKTRKIALNVVQADEVMRAYSWPSSVTLRGSDLPPPAQAKGPLLTLALLLLMLDVLASLALAGRLGGGALGKGASAAAVIALLFAALPAAPVHAQSGAQADDFLAMRATRGVVLAHVLTGDAAVDDIAAAGLRGLGEALAYRTNIEPELPMAVNIETDELDFYPFLYWPISAEQDLPSDKALAKLNRFLRTGGMIMFDTRSGDLPSAPEEAALQALTIGLDIPPLEPVPQDHVLGRSFYLLSSFPGRYEGGPVWVEAAPESTLDAPDGMPFRNLNDGVTPVIIGSHDWAGAWAVDENLSYLLPVGRGFAGEQQREYAYRFGINVIMHVLTGNYKSDQVHVPALLDRLGQ